MSTVESLHPLRTHTLLFVEAPCISLLELHTRKWNRLCVCAVGLEGIAVILEIGKKMHLFPLHTFAFYYASKEKLGESRSSRG